MCPGFPTSFVRSLPAHRSTRGRVNKQCCTIAASLTSILVRHSRINHRQRRRSGLHHHGLGQVAHLPPEEASAHAQYLSLEPGRHRRSCYKILGSSSTSIEQRRSVVPPMSLGRPDLISCSRGRLSPAPQRRRRSPTGKYLHLVINIFHMAEPCPLGLPKRKVRPRPCRHPPGQLISSIYSAYERYSEGRKDFTALLSASRNLARLVWIQVGLPSAESVANQSAKSKATSKRREEMRMEDLKAEKIRFLK